MHAIGRRTLLMVGLLGSLGVAGLSTGCATAGGGSGKPLPRDQVIGSSWKLVAESGHMDHRVIKFEKKDNRLVGTLISKGRVLSQIVGINEGMEMFAVSPAESPLGNRYEGIYRTYMGDGRLAEQQVTVEFFDDHFTWDLQSATWSRVE